MTASIAHLDEHAEFPPRLDSFALRLKFVRIFVAGYDSAEPFAEFLGFPPSTYGTWEKNKRPRDKVEVAQKVHAAYPSVTVEWLLTGGELTLFTYRDSPTMTMVSPGHPRLPFDLPPTTVRPALILA